MNGQNINPKSSTRNPEIQAKIKSAMSGFCGVKKPDEKKTYTIERPTVYGDVVNDEIRKKLCTYLHYDDGRNVPCCYCGKAVCCIDLNSHFRAVEKIRACKDIGSMQRPIMENYVVISFEDVLLEHDCKDKPCDGRSICRENRQWRKQNRRRRLNHGKK